VKQDKSKIDLLKGGSVLFQSKQRGHTPGSVGHIKSTWVCFSHGQVEVLGAYEGVGRKVVESEFGHVSCYDSVAGPIHELVCGTCICPKQCDFEGPLYGFRIRGLDGIHMGRVPSQPYQVPPSAHKSPYVSVDELL